MILTQLEHGGAQTAMFHLQQEFEAKGHVTKIVFLYAKDAGAYPDKTFACLADTRPVGARQMLAILWRLSRLWRDFRPTHVLARTHYAALFMAALKAIGHGGKSVAIQANVASYPPRLARLGDRIAGSLGLYRKNVCVSAATAASFGNHPALYRKRLRVIDNGVPMPEQALPRDAARRELGLPQDVFLAGNCGRLARQKNQVFLVTLLARMPHVHLAIAGDGPDRQALLDLAAKLGVTQRLTLLGPLPHARIGVFYAALDLFLLPSLHEGRSNALLEAMSFGLPVIGNDVPTISETLGGAGELAPLHADSWVALIEGLKADAERRARLGETSRLRAQGFSMAACGAAYLRMLDEL